MHIRSSYLLLLLGLALMLGCKSKMSEETSVEGIFASFPNEKLYIYQLLPATRNLVDSVITDAQGRFKLFLSVKNAGFFLLKTKGNQEATLIVSPNEKIVIKQTGKLMREYTVEGSKESELYAAYNGFTSANLSKVDSMSKVFAEIRERADFASLKEKLDSAYIKIFEKQRQKTIEFAENHPSSLASLLAISNDFGPNILITERSQPALYLKLDSALNKTYPDNVMVNTFHQRINDFRAEIADKQQHDKTLGKGMPAPEIALPDAKGKIVKLSSLHGKLTLLYFWGSWNAPSRQTNLNLCKTYSKFHNRGLEIYAVSIDSDAELWQKAYMLDKAYWTQVRDSKGLNSDYCRSFAVKVLPSLMLIGKDGNIVKQNPDSSELDQLIEANL